MKKKRKIKKRIRIIFSLLCFVFLICLIGLVYGFYKNSDEDSDNLISKVFHKEEVKKLKIVDVESDSRPYAIMINNHPEARKHHVGLQDAYIVYEMIVEGGYTRLMGIYKDANLEKVGSIRSARHYFLDYALENDAVYVHWGWSPQAEIDISKYGIDNINGLVYEDIYFYRDNKLNVAYEHRGFTNTKLLDSALKRLKYRSVTSQKLLFNYSIDKNDISGIEGSKVANNVSINYSNLVTTSYVYDSANGVYLRYVDGVKHTDYETGKQYSAKNIIVYQVKNYKLSNDNKGRQGLDNIGSGSGFYITNGYAVPIKWEKKSRSSQTKYYYENGKEIILNDGNTFVQIQPIDKELLIS